MQIARNVSAAATDAASGRSRHLKVVFQLSFFFPLVLIFLRKLQGKRSFGFFTPTATASSKTVARTLGSLCMQKRRREKKTFEREKKKKKIAISLAGGPDYLNFFPFFLLFFKGCFFFQGRLNAMNHVNIACPIFSFVLFVMSYSVSDFLFSFSIVKQNWEAKNNQDIALRFALNRPYFFSLSACVYVGMYNDASLGIS